MTGSTLLKPGKNTGLLGIVFLVPALLIAIPGILFSLFGSNIAFARLQNYESMWVLLTSPAVVLGGLAGATLINLLSVATFNVESTEVEVKASFQIKKNTWNIIPLALGGILALVIFLYLVVENFGPLF